VNNLTLCGCQGITDVSSLGRVHTLDLSQCRNISDISALKNVHTLDVSDCKKVLDLSGLENVYSFRASGFRGNDVSGLKNVVILDICDSPKVSDVTMLRSLKELNIEGCNLTQDFTGLVHLRKLSITETIVVNRESVPQLRELKISFVQDGNYKYSSFWIESAFLLSLKSLQELFLFECNSLENLPSFPCLRSLSLELCENFRFLPILPSLGYLSIRHCDCLTNPEILGSAECTFPIYSAIFLGCSNLTTLTIDRKIFECQVSLNDRLEIIEVNQQVGHLKIDHTSTAVLEKITNQSLLTSLEFVDSENYPHYQLNEDTDELMLKA
jgi:Leucine-rich repeat (LRR) protein